MVSTDLIALAKRRMKLRQDAERAMSLTVSRQGSETVRLLHKKQRDSAENLRLTRGSVLGADNAFPQAAISQVSRESHSGRTYETPASFDDTVERAAIQAEALPVRRTRKRMVSWADPADVPQPGDYCGCCSGALWWTDATPPRGWCCTTCHPPAHLEAGQFRVVAT